jgi:hypothetical protein
MTPVDGTSLRTHAKSALLLRALAPALVVCACQHSPLAPTGDSGGNLRAYVAEVRRLNAEGAPKAIRGRCASACTIFLGVKNVCVEPTAQLWFHAAHFPNDRRLDPLGSLEMLAFYPPRIREWVIHTGALESVDFDEAKKLTGEQLVLMGVAPCSRTSDAAPSMNAPLDRRPTRTT